MSGKVPGYRVSVDPSGLSVVTGTDVQTAIEELDAGIGGGGSALTVQDENSNVSTSVTQIDFQGAGVSATSGTGEVIVTIPGAGTPLVTIDDPGLWGTLQSETYEFDADTTSLPSGWSWLNQGSATYKEKYGLGGVACVGAASYNSRGLYRAEPSASTYTAAFKLRYTLLGVGGSPSANCGIFLRHSGSGKLVQYGVFSSGNTGIETANSATSYSGNTGLVPTQFQPWAEMYLRIVKASATSYSFGLSADGIAWDDTSTAYNPQTFFGGAVTDIGFYFNSTATTRTAGISCEWLRVV